MATYPITADNITINNISAVKYKPDYTYWVGLNGQNFDVINNQTVKSSRMITPPENEHNIINVGDVWDYTKQSDQRLINSGVIQGIVCPAPYTQYKTSNYYPCTTGYFTRLNFKDPLIVPDFRNASGVAQIYDNYWEINSIRVYRTYSSSFRLSADGTFINEGTDEGEDYFYIDVYNMPNGVGHGFGGLSIDLGFGLYTTSLSLYPLHVLDYFALWNKASTTYNSYPNIRNKLLSMSYGALEIYPPNLFVSCKTNSPTSSNITELPYRVSSVGSFWGNSYLQIYKAGVRATYDKNRLARDHCWYLPFSSDSEREAVKSCNSKWEENVLALYKNDPNRA